MLSLSQDLLLAASSNPKSAVIDVVSFTLQCFQDADDCPVFYHACVYKFVYFSIFLLKLNEGS